MNTKVTDYTIVIEGCDLTGKDTLCLKLARKYGLDIVHCTSHDPKDDTFYLQSMRKKNVVYSRNWIGELIYPAIYKRTPSLSIPEANSLNTWAKDHDVKTLVLTADNDELLRRLEIRGEEVKSVRDNLAHINSEFVRFANMFDIPVVDTSKVDFDLICHYIETGEIVWKESTK